MHGNVFVTGLVRFADIRRWIVRLPFSKRMTAVKTEEVEITIVDLTINDNSLVDVLITETVGQLRDSLMEDPDVRFGAKLYLCIRLRSSTPPTTNSNRTGAPTMAHPGLLFWYGPFGADACIRVHTLAPTRLIKKGVGVFRASHFFPHSRQPFTKFNAKVLSTFKGLDRVLYIDKGPGTATAHRPAITSASTALSGADITMVTESPSAGLGTPAPGVGGGLITPVGAGGGGLRTPMPTTEPATPVAAGGGGLSTPIPTSGLATPVAAWGSGLSSPMTTIDPGTQVAAGGDGRFSPAQSIEPGTQPPSPAAVYAYGTTNIASGSDFSGQDLTDFSAMFDRGILKDFEHDDSTQPGNSMQADDASVSATEAAPDPANVSMEPDEDIEFDDEELALHLAPLAMDPYTYDVHKKLQCVVLVEQALPAVVETTPLKTNRPAVPHDTLTPELQLQKSGRLTRRPGAAPTLDITRILSLVVEHDHKISEHGDELDAARERKRVLSALGRAATST